MIHNLWIKKVQDLIKIDSKYIVIGYSYEKIIRRNNDRKEVIINLLTTVKSVSFSGLNFGFLQQNGQTDQ